MQILETERLVIREITPDDAPFVLELLNTHKFIKYIADRGVRTIEDGRRYIDKRFVELCGEWLRALRCRA